MTKIYIWKIKLKFQKIDTKKTRHKKEKSDTKKEVRDIKIGLVYVEDGEFSMKYTIHGNGSLIMYYKQYCCKFKEDDIITVHFDSAKKTLSYGRKSIKSQNGFVSIHYQTTNTHQRYNKLNQMNICIRDSNKENLCFI
eukprot:432989_1